MGILLCILLCILLYCACLIVLMSIGPKGNPVSAGLALLAAYLTIRVMLWDRKKSRQ